ncbi:MAG: PDZ domain-containing protein, partial [Chloroflexales bacterium]|nr:PDZ domain-containing protein [Chloroflexales bacterium]
MVRQIATSQRQRPTRRFARWGALLLCLISLSALGSIGWAAYIPWSLPYDGLMWTTTGRITSIDPAGPATQTGLQVGDRVASIDGRSWQL